MTPNLLKLSLVFSISQFQTKLFREKKSVHEKKNLRKHRFRQGNIGLKKEKKRSFNFRNLKFNPTYTTLSETA